MTLAVQVDRQSFLVDLIGKPWVANAKGPDAWDCYHLVQWVEGVLFGRVMSDVDVPNEPSWPYIVRMIREHPERDQWVEFNPGPAMKLPDGTIVAMAASQRAAHLGVWLEKERGVIHVDNPDGVVFHDLSALKALGWHRLIFFRPRGSACSPVTR